MPKIKVIMAGVSRGPFSEEMVRYYLEQGILLPTDLAQLEQESDSLPLADLLDKLALLRPTERFIRKKKKTSSAIARARKKKLMIVGAYLSLAVCLALAFLFQDTIVNIFDTIDYWFYQEWTTIAF